jgi:carbon-monoxide dehydrogenase medium subunit
MSVEGFHTPATVAEALALKADLGDGAVFLAGGTDLGVQLRRRLLEPAHLISLGEIPGLSAVEELDDGTIAVGGAVTHRTIEESPLFSGALEALREACRTVGSVQTRSVGTVGGNLCNASPAADTPPVLLALGASVVLAGPAGRRTLPLDEFIAGYRATALRPAELLESVLIPAPAAATGSAFLKAGRRRAMEISIVCAGVRIDLAPDGTIAGAGIGLGSVAPTTVRAASAEEGLRGLPPGPEAFAAAGAAALDACDPIDDVRAGAAYRRAMIPVMVRRALEIAAARAGGAA